MLMMKQVFVGFPAGQPAFVSVFSFPHFIGGFAQSAIGAVQPTPRFLYKQAQVFTTHPRKRYTNNTEQQRR